MRSSKEVINMIKELRVQQGISMSELSRLVGVSKATLSRYESGQREFPINDIGKYAKALHKSINELLGLDIDNYDDRPSPVTSTYNYFDTGLSAGILTQVNPFTSNNVEQISLSDVIMGKYAGDPNIFISHINGESMNRVIPDKSLIAIKKYSDIKNLKNGDIVVFRDGGDMSVKRFYNNPKSKTISFTPDSTDKEYEPIIYRYEDAKELEVIGRVVVYTVEL